MDHKTNEFLIQWASLKLKMFAIQKTVLENEKISLHPGENITNHITRSTCIQNIFLSLTIH